MCALYHLVKKTWAAKWTVKSQSQVWPEGGVGLREKQWVSLGDVVSGICVGHPSIIAEEVG